MTASIAGDGSTGGTRSASRPRAGLGPGAELVELRDQAAPVPASGSAPSWWSCTTRWRASPGAGAGAELVELRDQAAPAPASGSAPS